MPKLTLNTINSRYASVSALNDNFDLIEAAIENTLSRDGSSPNTMQGDLDMNSNSILNLPDPTTAGEPATKGWVEAQPNTAAASAADAADSADLALASELAAVAAAAQVVGWEYEGTWITSRAYAVNNIVTVPTGTYEGWSFICLLAHTSGTFTTDYGLGRWGILAKRGAAGAGTGDMLAANNLSDVANVGIARTNLGGTTTGIAVFTAANAGAARSTLAAAASGANSDITSLTGLTTALSASRGGTGLASPGTAGNVLTSNGSAWTSTAPTLPALKYDLYTSGTATWTCPTGVTRIKVICIGGGGGGSAQGASSGGSGGFASGIYTVTPGTGYAVTVGAGNAGTVTTFANGTAGGNSSLGSLISASGGGGGLWNAGSVADGSGSNGNLRTGVAVSQSRAGEFSGSGVSLTAAGLTAAVSWSTSSAYFPGAGGAASDDYGGGYAATGGVGGIVYIEYVG